MSEQDEEIVQELISLDTLCQEISLEAVGSLPPFSRSPYAWLSDIYWMLWQTAEFAIKMDDAENPDAYGHEFFKEISGPEYRLRLLQTTAVCLVALHDYDQTIGFKELVR